MLFVATTLCFTALGELRPHMHGVGSMMWAAHWACGFLRLVERRVGLGTPNTWWSVRGGEEQGEDKGSPIGGNWAKWGQNNLVGAKGNDSETQSKEDYNPSSEDYFKQMS
jgi:hypothetical protein